MPCACKKCLQHAWTLGLPSKPPSKTAIRKAFKAAAKLWHPDRFENEPIKRAEAEERFKKIQVAYRELWEHSENPELSPADTPFARASVKAAAPIIEEDLSVMSFGGAPGCFAPPYLPARAAEIIIAHLETKERVLGIVDLSGAGLRTRTFAQYILFTSNRIFVRNHLSIVSLLWYTDLGEINLVDLGKQAKPSVWQRTVARLNGARQTLSLQIYRANGTPFFSITDQADDNVKKVIYNFLLQKKAQTFS